MADEYEDDLQDPGGVPRTLSHNGYRSFSPVAGFSAVALLVAIVGAVLWGVVVRPKPSLAATPPPVTRVAAIADPQTVVPDPQTTPLGVPRTHPLFGPPHHAAATSAPEATTAVTTTATYAQPQYVEHSVPRVKTIAEVAADSQPQRLNAARDSSSRMMIETQDAQAERDLRNADTRPPSGEPTYPTRAAPPASTSFASDDAPHGSFVARHSGDPGYQAATSRYELVAGTFIPVRLITTVDSSLPGGIMKAAVVETIFDSATHSVVVLPIGTIAVGVSDSAAVGEARLASSWTEFLLPNGRKFFASANQGAGVKGEAGMPAAVDTHAGRAFGHALVGAVLTAGVNLASRASTVIDVGTTTTVQPQQAGPTLHAYAGQLFNIVLSHDLPLDRYAAP